MTSYGGTNGAGVIFTTDQNGNNYQVKHSFGGTQGANPYASLFLASDGNFYGTTYNGGTGAKGTVFKYDTTTNVFTKIHDFNGANGHNPSCTFIEAPNGKLYGTTWQGGTSNIGTLFELDITQSPAVFTKKIDFSGTDGRYLQSGLMITSENRIFGVTQTGGTNGYGVIFEYNHINNTVSVHHNFAEATGRQPFGSLMEASNGKLYAITKAGGSFGYGVIFKFDPSDNSYENVHNFNGTDGNQGSGDLIEASDGFLYGLSWGGGFGNGTIYQFDLVNNTATEVHKFNNTNGKNPYGTMAESVNGKLYGMTSYGGLNNAGVLFEFNISNFVLVKKHDFSWANTGGGGFPLYTKLVTGGNDNQECQPDTTNISATTCDPEQVGITQNLFTNNTGCDSLVITTTNLLPSDTTYIAATTCNSAQVGVTQSIFTNLFGCDSVVITTTTLLPGDTTYIAATTCDPTQVGVSQSIFSNLFGCDSTVITTTTLLPSDTTYIAATTCDPAQVGVSQSIFSNLFGCDSVVITTTTLLPDDTTYIAATTCDPAQVGVTQIVLSNIFGCDSTVITTTTLIPSNIDITCPGDIFVDNDGGLCGAIVSYVVPVGTGNCGNVTTVLTSGLASGANFPVGTTTVVYTATDESGNTSACNFNVTVTDIETPVISAISDAIIIQPSNHKYETFDINDFYISVHDNCPGVNIYISKVESNETENENGSGNTLNDFVISSDGQTVMLRKERSGIGNGRIYTIYLEAMDAAGNIGYATAEVHVPLNNSNKSGFIVTEESNLNDMYCYPNPFNEKTRISFTTKEAGEAILKISNVQGKEIETLFKAFTDAGEKNNVEFNAKDLPEGIYIYSLYINNKFIKSEKLILSR